ncbi:DMT family transporter [Nocardioides antri]|uniref:DMT family transporter n=1 Tax=Nocardioides antri TaxID=2607659 RepID=A0A5B1M307_9ACTN|nr:DMT family transporter [Nocardioides antri]KAA1426157.1 DMT family transporter [Nocardioides antri]
MGQYDSATRAVSPPLPPAASGLAWGLVGVAAFSFTVPLTRVAVGGLSPLFIGAGRAVVAALLAGVALAVVRAARPVGIQWLRIGVVAAGVVVGFPLLTSYALTVTAASHSAVVIALLPAVTAVVAALRTGERPPRIFWWCSAAGAAAAVAFAILQGGGLGELHGADLLLFGAVLAAAIGYAEGGLLAREIGSWQTVSWALVVASPLMVVLTGVAVAEQVPSGTAVEWASFAYLSAVSMYLGFFAWYRGLAIGPMPRVSQVQLVQPVMSICWAGLLLGEHIGWTTFGGGLVVIACAAGAVRSRLATAGGSPGSGPAEVSQPGVRLPHDAEPDDSGAPQPEQHEPAGAVGGKEADLDPAVAGEDLGGDDVPVRRCVDEPVDPTALVREVVDEVRALTGEVPAARTPHSVQLAVGGVRRELES